MEWTASPSLEQQMDRRCSMSEARQDCPALQLSHDDLRSIFAYVPELDRRALQPVCTTWAAVGATCDPLWTSATIDAEEYVQRRGRQLPWQAACTWLLQRAAARPTVSIRLTTGHHTMPAGGLFSLLPALADSLRDLRLHLRAPGLTSRDFVGLGRLTALTALRLDAETTPEVLVMGLRELQPLAGLLALSIATQSPPPAAEEPRWPDDFPTPNYADQYPTGELCAPFGLDLAGMPALRSFRFSADAQAVQFDALPSGLGALSALTKLCLTNCFGADPGGLGGLTQLQRLALEGFPFQTPQPQPPQPHGLGAVPPPQLPPPHPLAQLQALTSLQTLALRRCNLDVAGLRLVASMLPELQELDVSSNEGLHLQRPAMECSRLDDWWLKQYLAGRCRKRKSGELSWGHGGIANGMEH